MKGDGPGCKGVRTQAQSTSVGSSSSLGQDNPFIFFYSTFMLPTVISDVHMSFCFIVDIRHSIPFEQRILFWKCCCTSFT